jgi:hypothetical protein
MCPVAAKPMSDPFPQHIIPLPQAEAEEILVAHQITFEFYQEVRFRQALDDHCEWYQQVAQQHRRELEAMRNDINLLGWFSGRHP